MANKTIALLGAAGMLGTEIATRLMQKGLAFESFDLPQFDITDGTQLQRVAGNSRIIINCAAYTDVEKAESERNLAFRVNAEAAGWLGTFAKKAGVFVFHISTDFVFDGTLDRPYVETDRPNPINAYGASKLAGEKLLLESACKNCIIRVEWTYGPKGNNFVRKLIALSKQKDRLQVVDDQTGSPTSTSEVAQVIVELLDKMPEGIFHFANSGYVNRFEMAKFIFAELNMPVELISCKSSDFSSAAKRPLNSRFNCDKITSLLRRPITPWQIPLEKFLKQL